MIRLLLIPKGISRMVIRAENQQYIDEYRGEKGNITPDDILDIENLLDGYEYYHIYKNNIKIGLLTGFNQDEYWIAMRVWLSGKNKIYFKRVIEELFELKKQEGYKGVIAHPDEYTASIYKKHHIAEEVI